MKLVLSFNERKILERRGIIVSFLSQPKNDSITIKKKYNLNNISALIIKRLVKKNLIHDKINLIIKEVNNKLSTTEKIRKFIIVQDDFTQENGLLTPTMKIKKSLVFEKFKKQIENLYS